VQRVRKAVEPPGEARADWEILCDLSRACGYEMPDYAHPREIYAEMASLSPKFAGISHERLDAEGGLQWPCPTVDHPGTPTMHADGPVKGKGSFQAIAYRPSAELPDVEFPFVLSTGRTLYHYNCATQTKREEGSMIKQPRNFIELHPRDARKLGVAAGERVKVASRRGHVGAEVKLTRRVRPGCVWMPLHFSDDLVNRLTNDAGDAVTGTGEYKVCAVRVETIS